MESRLDTKALLISLLIHVGIVVVLVFSVLKIATPEVYGGILVNYGTVDEASGAFEPMYTGVFTEEDAAPPPPARTAPAAESKGETLTQDFEETVAVPKEEVKAVDPAVEARAREEERIRKEEVERKRVEDEQRKKSQNIQNKVSGAFGGGMGNTDSDSEGTAASGKGNQGSPFGNSDSGPYEGVGGYGGSFNLNGRMVRGGALPRPSYTIQTEGTIVVDITVDSNGNVISARIGKGTNIDNASMRNSAITAAKQAKFNSITGTNNQTGTITYKYSLT